MRSAYGILRESWGRSALVFREKSSVLTGELSFGQILPMCSKDVLSGDFPGSNFP